MAWIVQNRRTAVVEKPAKPYLTDKLKHELETKYFPRYPTRLAVLLPALHAVQEEYGWIPQPALLEIAEFLGVPPAEVMDTATFYEEYWLKPKGQYLVQVCRSLACEICGSKKITEHLQQKLGCELGETSADGRFTLIELECLGSCGTAPAVLVNDVLHENMTAESMDQILDKLPKDAPDYKDPTVDWDAEH
ncbi:MAG TPA: NADH-quinone oxidoreductase subunit NuoE [Tepidisphaeraceae bacterium]|nr:NADH-quinone oxidoreductase subunit NuoE [Tepidisphaeraceae bacterium]HUB27976.1 NADH-quinone oxidoreductase subunit NuoE [Tepidisphaeraceae bacterium]